MKPLIITLNILCAGDAISTHVAIRKYHAVEQFMPTQNPWAIDGLVTAQAISASRSLANLSEDHPKAARILGWTLIGIRGFAIASNVRQMLKADR